MKKVSITVLAMALFALAALPVWSGGASAGKTTGTSGWPAVTVGFDQINFQQKEQDGTWPTEIFNAVREKLQIDLKFIGYPDRQTLDLSIASGDLPDLLQVGDKSYTTMLLSADLVQPLDDYLKLAPNLVSSSPLRIAASRKYYSRNNDGKLYFITPYVGGEPWGKSAWNGMTIRWDYYKEAGYPAVKNEDDFLNVVADIVKKHPTTPEGKKVYGVSTFSDGSLWGWWIRGGLYGFHNITDNYSLGYSKTQPGKMDRVVSNFTDYDSPVWRDIMYYRKANKLGILDPDALTQSGSDLNQKASDGQLVATNCSWYGGDLYSIQRAANPDSMAQYMVLPVEGQYNWANAHTNIGWNFYYSVPRKAKNVESIMKLIDYLSTPDGIRMATNGPKGVLWDIINGKPQIKPETLTAQAAGGKEWSRRGDGLWSGLYFIYDRGNAGDGGLANLWDDPALLTRNLTPAEKDFSAHYGANYPAEAALNLIKQGKAWDRMDMLQDLLTLMPTPPQNVMRIDTACLDIMVKAIPRLVLAVSDTDFENLRTQLQKDLQAANIQTSIDWWMGAEKDVKAFLATVK